MSIPSDNKDDVDSGGFKKSIDERVFSDFDIDGSEKDWRQEAQLSASGSSLAYNTKADSKDSIEDFLDGMEIMAELHEARQKQMMRFSNGFEFTREEFEDSNDKIIEEIEADPAKFAEENDMTVAQAMLVLEMAKDAKESGVFDEDAMRLKYGDDAVDFYQGDIQNDIETARELKNQTDTTLKTENTDIETSADLNDEQHTATIQDLDDGFSDLGFEEIENTSTSLAKSVSQDETATASIKNDFGKAVNIKIADTNIPVQETTIEYQCTLTA